MYKDRIIHNYFRFEYHRLSCLNFMTLCGPVILISFLILTNLLKSTGKYVQKAMLIGVYPYT